MIRDWLHGLLLVAALLVAQGWVDQSQYNNAGRVSAER